MVLTSVAILVVSLIINRIFKLNKWSITFFQ
jgi:hypothetical protein